MRNTLIRNLGRQFELRKPIVAALDRGRGARCLVSAETVRPAAVVSGGDGMDVKCRPFLSGSEFGIGVSISVRHLFDFMLQIQTVSDSVRI